MYFEYILKGKFLQMNLLKESIGKIARDIPGATTVFHKFGLDFCCAGSKNLSVIIAEKGIDENQVLTELNELIQRGNCSSEWDDTPNDKLVTHIKNRYHDVHREQLPELVRLAQRVEQVHRNHSECPIGLTEHLNRVSEELEIHMKNEEEDFFPLVMNGQISDIHHLVDDLQNEHESHGLLLEHIEKMTNNMTPPVGACNTWQALYKGLQTFKIDLMQHIHLENNILFDRIKMGGL